MWGRVEAELLLVANERTRRALPAGVRGRVEDFVENGVDLSLWRPTDSVRPAGPMRVVFSGRLIDLKAVDVLIEAVGIVGRHVDVVCDILGDGPMRQALEQQARSSGLDDRVRFRGWLSQSDAAAVLRDADVLALPSVCECGGAVVLEAMACGKPVVATRWGGPADYIDEECGFLVEPESREHLVTGFAKALLRLGRDPGLGTRMGASGRVKAVEEFDWERKVDSMLGCYRDAMRSFSIRDVR